MKGYIYESPGHTETTSRRCHIQSIEIENSIILRFRKQMSVFNKSAFSSLEKLLCKLERAKRGDCLTAFNLDNRDIPLFPVSSNILDVRLLIWHRQHSLAPRIPDLYKMHPKVCLLYNFNHDKMTFHELNVLFPIFLSSPAEDIHRRRSR